MLFELESGKSLPEIDKGLQEAAARHKFGILAVHNLGETMKKKGMDFAGECVIYEICNPQQAKRVLDAVPAASSALPCRISVYRAGGSYRLSTILPTELMRGFQRPDLESVAAEVEEDIVAIMKESA